MYVICYCTPATNATWDLISGEDAMEAHVDELCKLHGLDETEIMVFDESSQV